MSFLRRFSKVLALFGAVSMAVWGLGCAQQDSAGPSPAANGTGGAEAGSTTAGGTDVPDSGGSGSSY